MVFLFLFFILWKLYRKIENCNPSDGSQEGIKTLRSNSTEKVNKNVSILGKFIRYSLNIFYLPIKYAKWIRHKLNKLMKSSPIRYILIISEHSQTWFRIQ